MGRSAMTRRLWAALVIPALALIVGCGSGSSAPGGLGSEKPSPALSHYRAYLRENGGELARGVKALALVVDHADVSEAGSKYAVARVPYGHIAPAAQLFPTLRRRIDGLEEEVPPSEYGGFHEIEKEVFWEKDTVGMRLPARRLQLNVEALRRRLGSARLGPTQIVAGVRGTLQGIVANEFPGAAERWVHCDLVDFAAKLEGVAAAYAAVKPLVADADPELARRIDRQLQEAYGKVGAYGTLARDSPKGEAGPKGIQFVVYDQVTQRERWEIVQPFKALAKSFALAAAQISRS